MPFVDENSGAMALAKGCLLTARMPAAEVLAALHALGGDCPDPGDIIPFPACPVRGGQVGAAAFLEEGRLTAIPLSVVFVGHKAMPPADQQRAYLFSLLRCKDPCPDTQRTCRLACAFGSILLSTDPRTGCAHARLSYD